VIAQMQALKKPTPYEMTAPSSEHTSQ